MKYHLEWLLFDAEGGESAIVFVLVVEFLPL